MGSAVTAPSPASAFPNPCPQAHLCSQASPKPLWHVVGAPQHPRNRQGLPRKCQKPWSSFPARASPSAPPRALGLPAGWSGLGVPSWGDAAAVGAAAVPGGWNVWDCGPGLSNVRMMLQARALSARVPRCQFHLVINTPLS